MVRAFVFETSDTINHENYKTYCEAFPNATHVIVHNNTILKGVSGDIEAVQHLSKLRENQTVNKHIFTYANQKQLPIVTQLTTDKKRKPVCLHHQTATLRDSGTIRM